MKTAVETLNPTRVRLTVEVPFEELRPSLDAAYKKVAQQVRIPGFRPGKVPPQLIDARFGRGVVLEEAVNDALPRLYSTAVRDNELQVLGQPEVDVTKFSDGEALEFTAEVDVRPDIELPEYDGIEVTVADADVSDDDVDESLQSLRERFATLTTADRAAQATDQVTLDIVATVDGEEFDEGKASGVSYEVGSKTMLDGLDEAVTGLSTGESATFTSKIIGGAHAGRDAEVTVTVKSVKEKQLPDLDDDFARSASEFDTLDELRADVRGRIEERKKIDQAVEARDKVLEALLAKMEVPLPEGVVAADVEWRQQSLQQQLDAAGMTKEGYLATEDRTEDDFDREVEERARESVKAQFVLDALATKEQLSVGESELTQHIVQRAARAGVSPEQFAQHAVENNQVPALVSEVVRGKALALIVERARVTDESGRVVNLSEPREDDTDTPSGEPADDAAAEPVDTPPEGS